MRDEHGNVLSYVGCFFDLGAVKTSDERTRHMAFHDPLTGLPNRVLAMDRLAQAMARTRRGGQVAVLFIDLDGFKPVNDELGHAIGDVLLKVIAGRLQALVRGGDTVARIGGDEFVAIIEVQDAEQAVLRAQEIIDAQAMPLRVAGQPLRITLSVGLAVFPGDGRSQQELLENADAAMYRAKRAGGNRLARVQAPVSVRARRTS